MRFTSCSGLPSSTAVPSLTPFCAKWLYAAELIDGQSERRRTRREWWM